METFTSWIQAKASQLFQTRLGIEGLRSKHSQSCIQLLFFGQKWCRNDPRNLREVLLKAALSGPAECPAISLASPLVNSDVHFCRKKHPNVSSLMCVLFEKVGVCY